MANYLKEMDLFGKSVGSALTLDNRAKVKSASGGLLSLLFFSLVLSQISLKQKQTLEGQSFLDNLSNIGGLMFALKVIGEILLCPINYQIVKTQIYSHWNVHEKLPLNTNFHLFLFDLFSSVGCINAAECFFKQRKREEFNKISRKFLEISLFTKPKRGIKIIKTKPDQNQW